MNKLRATHAPFRMSQMQQAQTVPARSLSPQEFAVLAVFHSKSRTERNQHDCKAIARATGIAPRTVATLIRTLREKGYLPRPTASPQVVLCSICKEQWVQVGARGDDKHPVCIMCWARRSRTVWGRGLPPENPPGCRWLYAILSDLWADPRRPNGFFSAASRDTCVSSERLVRWCYTPPPLPRRTTLHWLADGITRRQLTLGRSDPALTPERILQAFGWTRTYEDEIERRRSQCSICDVVQRRKDAVCFACNPLHRILKGPVRTDFGKYLFTLMALVRGLSSDKITRILKVPPGTMETWEARLRPNGLMERIDTKMAKGLSLFRATATALGVSANTLSRFLHGIYQPKGKHKRMAPTFTRLMDLAAKLNLEEDEFLRMARVRELTHAEKRERMRLARVGRARQRGILPAGPGRPHTGHGFVQAVMPFRWRRCSWQKIADDLIEDRLPQAAKTLDRPEDQGLEPKALRARVLRCGCNCPSCRKLVAMDLNRAEGRTVRDIASRLDVSAGTVHADLSHVERTHPLAYRLTTGQVAARLGVSRNTVRRLVDRGRLTSRRTPGGYRYFEPRDITQ